MSTSLADVAWCNRSFAKMWACTDRPLLSLYLAVDRVRRSLRCHDGDFGYLAIVLAERKNTGDVGGVRWEPNAQ